jgi:hypothetical protein
MNQQIAVLRWTARFAAIPLLCLCLALLLVSQPATAQVLYGSLTGAVTDASGAPVPNANVEALNVETGIPKTTATNEAGVYTLTTLQPGKYQVTIAAASFAKVIETGIVVNVNAVTRVNAELKVASVTENVTVTAAAEAMQTDRGDVHADITTRQLTDLPIVGSAGRNFESLLKLVPGITPPAEQNSTAANPGRAMSYNVNGISRVNNNVKLDGAGIIYGWLPYLISYVPPAEDIQEVNIETNSMLPEQGTAGGSAMNVIVRSGTNQFHGAAWEYNINTDLNARPFFTYTPVARNIINTFGARMGGPIKHNKLFFFGGWERTMQRQAINGLVAIPPSALRGGNFSGVAYKGTPVVIYDPSSGNADGTGRQPFAGNQIPKSMLSQPALDYLSLLPGDNYASNPAAGNLSDYTGSGSYALTRDSADGKISYSMNNSTQIFGRYSILNSTIADPFQFGKADGGTWDGGQPGAGLTTVQSYSIGGTHTFSPTVLIDGNAGFTRQHLGAQPPDVNTPWTNASGQLEIPGTNTGPLQGGIPFFGLTGWANMGNSNTGSPFLFRDMSWAGNANLSWTKQSHQLRFGVDYNHQQLNHFQPQGGSTSTARGAFFFNGDMTSLKGGAAANPYNSLADFLLGLTSSTYKVTQYVNPNALRWSTRAFYAQDQWQVSQKLTLTYGARYEFYPFLTRDHTGNYTYVPSTNTVLIGCENGVPCDTGVSVGWGFIAPRFGFAYRIDNKTVIRGGVGLSEDPDNYRDMRNTYPAVLLQQYVSSAYQAAGLLSGINYTLPQGTTSTFAGVGIPAVVGPNLSAGKLTLPNNVGTQALPNPYQRGYIESFNLSGQRDLGQGFTATVAYVGTHEVRQMSNVNINAGPAGGGNSGRLLYVLYGTVNGDINSSMPMGSVRYDALQSQLTRRLGSAQLGANYTWSRAMNFGDDSTYNGLTFAYPVYWPRNWAAAGYDRTHNFQMWVVYELPFGKNHRFVQEGPASWILGGWQANTIFSAASGTPFTVTTTANANAPGNTNTANQVASSVAILGNVGPGQQWFDATAYAAPAAGTLGNTGRNSLRGPGFFELDAAMFRSFTFLEKYSLQFKAQAFAVTNTPIFGNPNAQQGGNNFGQITSLAASANGVSNGGGYRIMQLALKFEF